MDDVRHCLALRRADALPGFACSHPAQGSGATSFATGLRSRAPAARKEPEPTPRAGGAFGCRRGAPCRSASGCVGRDRGFCRAGFLSWLEYHNLHYVVRLTKGACITEPDGKRWKLGEEGLRLGELRFCGGVRYGLYHGRPRELFVNVALCWRVPKGQKRRYPSRQEPAEAWYLATSLEDAKSAASWYRQRGWIEHNPSRTQREPLWVGAGAGAFSGTPEPFAGRAHHHCAVVANVDGAAGDRGHAAPLARGGIPARACQRDQPCPRIARPPPRFTAILLAAVSGRRVGGYASGRSAA